MYKYVSLIDQTIKDYEAKHPEIVDTLTHYHPPIEPIQRKFAKDNGLSYHDALSVSAGAIKNQYISPHEEEVNHDLKQMYCMEPDGYRLVEHIGKYPYGLVTAILKDLGPTLTLIFGLLGSGIFLLLWKLIRHYIIK